MKKLLVFLVMFGVLAGMMGVGVMGDTSQGLQNTTMIVGQDIQLAITPTLLDFGVVIPSQSPKIGPNVTFNPIGSNVNLSITAQVTANTLFEGIELNHLGWTPINNTLISLPYGSSALEIMSRISIPIGTIPGTQTGVITYTVTGVPPAP